MLAYLIGFKNLEQTIPRKESERLNFHDQNEKKFCQTGAAKLEMTPIRITAQFGFTGKIN